MKLTVIKRQKKDAKTIRKEGFVPGIVYGKHLEAPIGIKCKRNDLIKRYKEAGYSTPITLEGDDIKQLVLIQDIQVDPVTDVLMHIDFLAINADEKVKTEVPLILVGESPIEKLAEGKVQLVKDFVEVEAFPQDLPQNISIDISTIENVNDTIFVKDLKIADKVELLDDPEQALVTVLTMTEEVIEETPTEGEEGETEGEGEKKEGEGEKKEGEGEKKEEEKKE